MARRNLGGFLGTRPVTSGDGGLYDLRDQNILISGGKWKGASIYPFTSFTFTSIVAAGSNVGPTLTQMQTAYAGQPFLNGFFSLGTYQGYQRWTVSATSSFEIEAGGAMGGDSASSISPRAYGALIRGTFNLTAGHILEIVVGVKGGNNGGAHGNENGGGGGTFIRNVTTNQLLLVAGGAGGCPSSSYGTSCSRTITTGHGQAGNAGGVSGCDYVPTTPSLGNGGNTAGSYQGGAGGGYNSAGANGGTHCSTAIGGGGFNNGLVGGTGNSCYTSENKGGFGGGGGGNLGTPGGGGGYTGGSLGGSWSSYSNYGGGGGSYNIGSNPTNTTGGNTGNLGGYTGAGYCKITVL